MSVSDSHRLRMRAVAGKLWRAIEPLERRALLAAHIVGSPTVYSTIQAAVNAASAGSTINVDAGAYPELVTIGKSLTLRGAQAGMDGRLNPRRSGANESIVTGSGAGTNVTSAFYINGSYHAKLPVGQYELVVAKGPEYRFVRRNFNVENGQTQTIREVIVK